MANRYFTQFFYTPHKMPVMIDCNIAIGSTGAVGTIKGPGVSGVTRLGTGLYQIKLQDNYYKFYKLDWNLEAPVTGSDVTDGSFSVGTVYQITAVGTTDWTAAALVAREGGAPDICIINFTSYAALEKSLGAKVMYVDVKHEEADIAFAGIRIHAPYGPITVIPDRSCPAQTAYLLQMDTWKFRSLGKAPHVLTYGLEGLEGLRVGRAS